MNHVNVHKHNTELVTISRHIEGVDTVDTADTVRMISSVVDLATVSFDGGVGGGLGRLGVVTLATDQTLGGGSALTLNESRSSGCLCSFSNYLHRMSQ